MRVSFGNAVRPIALLLAGQLLELRMNRLPLFERSQQNRGVIRIQRVEQKVDQLKTADTGSRYALKGIRIPVFGLKGRCPRPLDDEGPTWKSIQCPRTNDKQRALLVLLTSVIPAKAEIRRCVAVWANPLCLL